MRAQRAFSKLSQLSRLPPAAWPAYLRALWGRHESGLIPCVLPETRRAVMISRGDFEQSYRFFAEAAAGKRELGFFLRKLRPGDVFFDIGAFRGVYGCGAKAALGDRLAVHFFEPLPENLRRLESTLAANAFGDVTVVARAVGNGSAMHGQIGEDMMLRQDEASDTPAFASTSLDAYIAETGVSPSVLKIDVEGFESAVLDGAQECLARRHPRIWLELHPARLAAQNQRWEDLLERLRTLGYRVSFFPDFDFPTRDLGFHVWCES